MMASMVSIILVILAGLTVLWAFSAMMRSRRRMQRGRRAFQETVHRVRRDQHFLAEGLIPEFDVPAGADLADVKQRYLAGEDIPLRWRQPR